MRSDVKVVALWCGLVILFLAAPAAAQPRSMARAVNAQKAEAYGRLPLTFEPNQGQTSPEVKFLARGPGYGLFLTSTEMVLALRQPPAGSQTPGPNAKASALRMKLVGANRRPQVVGERELPGKSNYFTGRDPAKWRRNVPQFAGVRYGSVYPGVDLVYYGNQRQLEYDFVVAPGADPRRIRLRFTGMSSMKVNLSGDLVLATGGQEVSVRAPVVYQEIDGAKQTVAGRFVVRGWRDVGFEVGRYNTSRSLVIDPTLTYATYLGGSGWDKVHGGAVDPAGNLYLTGSTFSPNFPVTGGVSEYGAFIAKLSADGRLVYSTFVNLGGESFKAIAVDAEGHVYVAGITYSTETPVVNAVQTSCPTTDPGRNVPCNSGFVLKLGVGGDTLIYSTFLGGEVGWKTFEPSIATDSSGNTYVAMSTSDATLPVVNPFQITLSTAGNRDAYVVKLDPQGWWVYATYLGGSSEDRAMAVAADQEGNAYVVGLARSSDFPTTANAIQPTKRSQQDGGADGFVTKLLPDGSDLVYSTYLGGSFDDEIDSVVVNAQGIAWIAGRSWGSWADFPTTPGWPSPSVCEVLNCPYPGVLVKLDKGGQVIYSTATHFFDPKLAVDPAGNVYLAEGRNGVWYPLGLVNPLMAASGVFYSVAIEKLDPTAKTVLFSTFLGGTGHQVCGPEVDDRIPCTEAESRLASLGVDAAGNIYAIGWTTQDDFPTVNALQPTAGGFPIYEGPWFDWYEPENFDIFVTKIAQDDNTAAGQQVAVVPAIGSSITFEEVTSPGTTSFTRSVDNSYYGWSPPTDLRLGDPPIYCEISTTASYTGGVTICLDYSNITFSVEWGLGLYHYENGTWTDITTRPVDTANNRICGVATSLSPFGIFGAPLPPVDVVGLAPPLAPLALLGTPIPWPEKAFKLGRTLPLKLQLLVNGVPLTDQEVKAPTIVQLARVGESPLNLDTMDLDAGEANDNSLTFRFTDGSWVYNLGTQGLSAGSYIITIQLWDGRRFQGGFALKK